MKRSAWDTTYSAANGSRVRARLVFNGDSGYYETRSGIGRLSGIEYRFDTAGEAGGTRWAGLITGNWAYGGSRGKFSFRAGSREMRLTGSWDYGSGRGDAGDWSGRFSELTDTATGSDGAADSVGPSSTNIEYSRWYYNDAKGYYYRKCELPGGAHQYLIYLTAKPNWVYWFNPETQVYWSACPTVNHPRWGEAIARGEDLFLIATTKRRNLSDCVFPDAGDDGANFTKGKAKDQDGSTVDLGCPPTDLP